jgi:hypothetical protein
MPDLLPIPAPLGGINFAEALEDAVISNFQAHVYLGDTGNVKTIRKHYPQDDNEPGPFMAAELPAIGVWAETGEKEPAASGAYWLHYTVNIIVVNEDGDRRTGRKLNERIRDEALTSLRHSSVDGSTTFLSSGHQVFVDDTDAGAVEAGLDENPHLYWSSSSVTFRILWSDPMI